MLYRPVSLKDAAALAAIHGYYVERTAITFVCATPTEESFREKIADIGSMYPFIVCEEAGKVLGFAYASALRPHDAYRWDVELSIYVEQGSHSHGVGTGLMERLLRLLRRQGFLNAYSCITLPNPKSLALHKHFDFAEVGMFPRSGYKLGAWHDVIWLCLTLGSLEGEPKEPVPFAQLTDVEKARLLE